MKITQVEIDLNEPGVSATWLPDPTGALVRSARAVGADSEVIAQLSEQSLTGGLRITLTGEKAQELLTALGA